MARRTKLFLKDNPKEVNDALKKYNGRYKKMTTVYNHMNDDKIAVNTPLKEVKEIAKQKSKQFNVPITVTTKPFDSFGREWENADGLAVEESNGKCAIFIHPIVKYTGKRFINLLIEHENDHVKVFRKRKGVQKPMHNKPAISIMK